MLFIPKKIHRKVTLILLMSLICFTQINAQNQNVNYDESKVPKYKLPDPLRLNNGKKVKNAKTWKNKRRPEILKLFEKYVYGKAPGKPENMTFKVHSIELNALKGKAVRKQVSVYFSDKKNSPKMDILIYLPKGRTKPIPIFLGLNFYGNHSIINDQGVLLSKQWMSNNEKYGVKNNRATEASRGVRSSRWAVEKILDRGYGLATIYYGDIDPDFDDGFQNGVHPLFYTQGQTKPAPDEWGSISAWAWGLSRAMDYFETDYDWERFLDFADKHL